MNPNHLPDGPETMRGMGGIGIYFEAAAVIVVLVLLGQMLELRARAAPAPRSVR